MDVNNTGHSGGSLQISSDVLEKIARQAALEIEGVASVKALPTGSAYGRLAAPKTVRVVMNNEVADVEIGLVVDYGVKIREISEKVQQNVKNAIQNMTGLTVGRVDLVVAGIQADVQNDA